MFEHCLKQLPLPVILLGAAHEVLFVNDAGALFIGSDALGGRVIQAVPAEHRPAFEAALAELSATGQRVRFETEPAGLVHHLLPLTGTPQILWVMFDESRERMALANQRRMDALLLHSREVLNLLDRNLKVIYRSPSSERPLGYTDGLVGHSAFEVVHPDDLAGLGRTLAAVFEHAGTTTGSTLRVRHADGSWRVLDLAATNLLEHPDVRAILLSYRDITEERQAEEQLIAASRLASVGALAASLGHEINNPLTYVSYNLGVALEALAEAVGAPAVSAVAAPAGAPAPTLPEELTPLLEQAREGAQRIASVVSELIALSEPLRDEIKSVDVVAVIERAHAMVQNQLRQRGSIVKKYDERLFVRAAESRLVQALVTLLLNAIQSLRDADGVIEVGAERASTDQVVISIRDNGAGISPQLLQRIFEPRFAGKAFGIGGGLGLWVVERFVHAFGGRIEVESRLGAGSTFRVFLPLDEPLSKKDDAPPTVLGETPPFSRLLVVDDEHAVGRGLQRVLRRRHHVTLASDGNQVLELIARGHSWDVVVCDVMMPGMDGLELHERVTELVPELRGRFVFITGGAFDASVRERLAAVDAPCIMKPPDIDELFRAIAERSGPRS